MPDKRMRPIVKEEPGAGGAQDLLDAAIAAATAKRVEQLHRADMDVQGAGTDLESQLRTANSKSQEFALQSMERLRAMGEELVAELRADIRIKDAALETRDSVHKAEVAILDLIGCCSSKMRR